MKLSKAINFLSGTVFQLVEPFDIFSMLRYDLDSLLRFVSFRSFLSFVGFRFQFDFLFSLVWFSLPLLSFSPVLAVCIFDLYSNYFHNEINRLVSRLFAPARRPEPVLPWLPARPLHSATLCSPPSRSFSLLLPCCPFRTQLLSESVSNRKSGSDLVQPLRRV